MFNFLKSMQPYMEEPSEIGGGADDFSDVVLENEVTTETEESTETVEDTKPTETVTETPKVKLKYNHEEKEFSLDEVVPLAQKGMNYDKLQERLKSLETDPRLSFVEELAKQQGYDDVNQYINAAREWQEQQRLNELVQKNIPEDLAKEIIENRKDREQRKESERKAQEEAQKQKQYSGLLDAFEMVNGKKWSEGDVIPDSVFVNATEKGISLRESYLEHVAKELKSQMQVIKQNESNAKKAPVQGVSTHGSSTDTMDDFIRGFDSVK